MLPFRRDPVIEDYHGTKVADPFRWLEDPNSPDTMAFIEAANKVSESYLYNLGVRNTLKQRLTELYNFPKRGLPRRVGQRYFFFQNDGLQNQPLLYLQEGPTGEPRLVLDPNQWSEDGTIALVNLSPNKEGTLLAYTRSESGSDWQTIHVHNVEAGHDLPDITRWCKFTNIAWLPDSSGFFYTRLPEPGSVPEEDAVNFSRVYFHCLGTDQSQDKLIYERPDFKELGFHVGITHDDAYLCLHVTRGTNPENRFYYRELTSDGPFIRLLDEHDAMYRLVGNDGPLFYFHTDLGAPNGRVIAIDITQPERDKWREIIPEQDAVLDKVAIYGDYFVVGYTQHAAAQLKLYNLKGEFVREIELPGIGTLEGLAGRREYGEFYFAFTSYLYPTTIFRYELADNSLTKFFQPTITFDPNQFETKQVFYPSKDGTRIPLFLTYKKELQLDGNNPTLLYGYGGYNISMTPAFSPHIIAWLEKGGVYAVACLRGGSEYGEEWHRAGMLENKQNVFDDFIAAAEWLIAEGYTCTPKLAIMGRSNGGLLVGACITQRPELYGAAICWVGVLDMLRYHLFSAGRYWTGEYGNAIANADHFRFMYRFSPIHNVKFATVYPPTLIRTAETDDRVVPMHSLKFYGALQSAAGNPEDIYLLVERKAGHGAGKPIGKQIDEFADILAFICAKLGVE